MATCIILNFYYLEEVWSLKITPKCYCFHFSNLITKHRNSHSIPNPKKVKVSIKFWKLQTIFKTFKPKEKVLDGFKLPAPQEWIGLGIRSRSPSLAKTVGLQSLPELSAVPDRRLLLAAHI